MRTLLIVLITSWFVCLIQATCVIKTTAIKENKPILFRSFGSKSIEVSYEKDEISLEEGETIHGFCSTGFRYDKSNNQIQSAEFKCDRDGQVIGDQSYNNLRYYGQNVKISCGDLNWNVYESKLSFSWCDLNKNLGSFIIAADTIGPKPSVAEICFDYKNMKPRIFKYFSVPKHYTNHNNLTKIGNLFENEISERNIFYKSILPPKSSPKSRVPTNTYWTEFENFEYSALVQNGILFSSTDLEGIVEVVWWRNLRIGNWRRYITALDKRSEHAVYKIYAGTFGIATVPEDVTHYHILEELRVFPEDEVIPLYIWNVVQEVNGTEEFVIVGLNTPFSDFLWKEDDKLCKNICTDISWLEDVQYLFDSSLLGKIICCTLEEANRFGMINGLYSSQALITDILPTDTTNENEIF